MKTTKQIQMIGTTVTLTLLFAVSPFQACGPGKLMRDGSSEQSSFAEGANGEMVPTAATKAVTVTHSESILTAITAMTETPPSAATTAAYTEHRSKITDTGKVESVNAPMWVAITSLSAESCRDLISKEKPLVDAQRSFFKGVDFTRGPASTADAALDGAVRKLARSAWARNETAAELTMLKEAIRTDFTATAGTETDKAMLYLCTAVMSALETHDQ